MAKFADLVRAQRESGKGVIGSLSGAYNQQNMQKFDVRNKLFSRSGLATSLFPGLKGYQAQPVSGKASAGMISPGVGNSPTVLTSIAKDARISARNSMALPSIARNMARMVRLMGGTPAKYFDNAAEKETAKEAKFGRGGKGGGALGKSTGGAGGGMLGMLGGALGGIGSLLGSAVGGIASVTGSILGGIGSLLGGAASGIFGVLSGALGGMGFMGILAAGAIGFVLYQIYKSLDFSKLGSGLGDSFKGIQDALSGLYKDVDGVSGNKLSKFVEDIKKTYQTVSIKMLSAIEVATELLVRLGAGVLKDFGGYFQNFFEENKGKIYALMAIGIMGPRALLTLPGAAITAIAAAVGAATSEKSTQELKEELFNNDTAILKNKEKLRAYREKNPNAKGRSQGGTDYELTNLEQTDKNLTDRRNEIQSKIDEKEGRTNNANRAVQDLSIENFTKQYDERVTQKLKDAGVNNQSTSPTPAGPNTSQSDGSGAGQVTFNSLSKEQQDKVLDIQYSREGNKKGQLPYDLNNPGAMLYGPFAAKYGAIPNMTRGTLKKDGKLVPFAEFPSFEKGREAQRALWSSVYGNKPLSNVLDAWVAPRDDKERAQLASYKEAIFKGIGVDGGGTQVADAGNKPTPKNATNTPAPPATPPASGGSSLLASLASPLEMLDKYTGGALGLGSVKVADMLRDLGNEAMDNPMFIDNSVNTSGGNDRAMATTASVWDQNILDTILNQRTT